MAHLAAGDAEKSLEIRWFRSPDTFLVATVDLPDAVIEEFARARFMLTRESSPSGSPVGEYERRRLFEDDDDIIQASPPDLPPEPESDEGSIEDDSEKCSAN